MKIDQEICHFHFLECPWQGHEGFWSPDNSLIPIGKKNLERWGTTY